jgi:hypothetical protein
MGDTIGWVGSTWKSNLSTADKGIMSNTLYYPFQLNESPNTTLVAPAWYVDAINGNDNNPGTTAALPLATLTNLANRWGKGNVLAPATGTTITVHIVNSTLATDIPDFDVILGPTCQMLVFVGTVPTPTAITGPFTVTTKDRTTPAGGTPWQLLTGASAAGLVPTNSAPNVRLFDSTQSAYFWGWKTSTDTVFLSEPVTFPGLGNSVSNANRITPVNTDTFQVQLLPQVNFGEMRIGGIRESGSRPQIAFQDICFGVDGSSTRTESFSIVGDAALEWHYYGCAIPRSIRAASQNSLFFENCYNGFVGNSGGGLAANVTTAYNAGVINGASFGATGASTQKFNIDCIIEASVLSLFAAIYEFGTCGVFDCSPFGTGTGAVNAAMNNVSVLKLDNNVGYLWGSNSACTSGISVQSGGVLRYNVGASNFNIVGSTPGTNDFVMGAVGSFSGSNYFPGISTGTVTATGPITSSWANFSAAQSASGYGGIAFNPLYNAWIVPV